MRLIFTVCLLAAILFVSAFSHAAPGSTLVADQSAKLTCPNPQIVTETTTHTIFAGPKLGWQKVPVEIEKIICPGTE